MENIEKGAKRQDFQQITEDFINDGIKEEDIGKIIIGATVLTLRDAISSSRKEISLLDFQQRVNDAVLGTSMKAVDFSFRPTVEIDPEEVERYERLSKEDPSFSFVLRDPTLLPTEIKDLIIEKYPILSLNAISDFRKKIRESY